jgi:hypothetical protein
MAIHPQQCQSREADDECERRSHHASRAQLSLAARRDAPLFSRVGKPARRTRAAAGIGLELLSGRRVCRRVRVPRAAWILDRIRSYRSSARVVKTIEGANRGPAPRISRMPDSAVRGSSTFHPPVVDRPLQPAGDRICRWVRASLIHRTSQEPSRNRLRDIAAGNRMPFVPHQSWVDCIMSIRWCPLACNCVIADDSPS